MDAIERTVVIPAAEVIVHRAARRQILWQRSPLTAGAQDIHQPVDDLTHVYGPLVAATLGWRNNQTDQRPFGISEVAGIAQRAAVIPSAVVVRPHRAGSCESPSRWGRCRPHPSQTRTCGFAESARGVSPRAAHRSGHEPLDSSGSCHPPKTAAFR